MDHRQNPEFAVRTPHSNSGIVFMQTAAAPNLVGWGQSDFCTPFFEKSATDYSFGAAISFR